MRQHLSELRREITVFKVAASKIVFEGFRTVYTEADEEKEETNVLLKGLDKDSV